MPAFLVRTMSGNSTITLSPGARLLDHWMMPSGEVCLLLGMPDEKPKDDPKVSPIVTIPAGTPVLLDGTPVKLATEVTVPNSALSSDERLMRFTDWPPLVMKPTDLGKSDALDATILFRQRAVGNEWAAEDRVRYAAMQQDATCKTPAQTPLEAAAGRLSEAEYLLKEAIETANKASMAVGDAQRHELDAEAFVKDARETVHKAELALLNVVRKAA